MAMAALLVTPGAEIDLHDFKRQPAYALIFKSCRHHDYIIHVVAVKLSKNADRSDVSESKKPRMFAGLSASVN